MYICLLSPATRLFNDRNDITLTMAMRHCHPMERFKHNMVLPASDSCDSFIDSIFTGTYICPLRFALFYILSENKKTVSSVISALQPFVAKGFGQ